MKTNTQEKPEAGVKMVITKKGIRVSPSKSNKKFKSEAKSVSVCKDLN